MQHRSRIPLLLAVGLAAPVVIYLFLALQEASGPSATPTRVKPFPATSLTALIPMRRSATDVVIAPPTTTPLPPGLVAPSFSLRGLDGRQHRLEDYRGKRVVLNFWATWCGPCRIEMPLLQATYDRLEMSGVVVIGINVEEEESAVRNFTDELRITFPILLDTDKSVTAQYRVVGLPTTFFIDAQGIIRATHVGALTAQGLQQYLDQLSVADQQ